MNTQPLKSFFNVEKCLSSLIFFKENSHFFIKICCLYQYTIFLVRLHLQSSFQFTAKLGERYRDFPIYPLTPDMHSLPHYQHPHQMVHALVTISEPTLTHHKHPKPIVCTTVHSWCPFCRFGQTYNGMHLSLWYHTEHFHCPNITVILNELIHIFKRSRF